MEQFKESVKKHILDNFLFESDENAVGYDDSFLEKGIIDSTGVMELVSFIEEEFNVSVDDDELIPENLDTINRLASFVKNKLENNVA
jgi:acyl carrier protein